MQKNKISVQELIVNYIVNLCFGKEICFKLLSKGELMDVARRTFLRTSQAQFALFVMSGNRSVYILDLVAVCV